MRAGSVIVKFRPRANQDLAHRQVGALAVKRLSLSETVRVQVQSPATERVLAVYRARPDVEYAEPDYLVRASATPSDPRFEQQYALTRISAPGAWDRTRSVPGVRIAVLDCGVFSDLTGRDGPDGRPGHPDLRGKVALAQDFTASASGTDDVCNHGTHVAGIAAAATDNAVGVAGVAPEATILNGKVLDDTGLGSMERISRGIIWAADNGARVINMSLGAAMFCPATLQDAINYAWDRGAVVVAAAGNGGADGVGLPRPEAPASCAHVVAVAATDPSDRAARFSNYGPDVEVAAPGVGILSTNNRGAYEYRTGTSQAAPHVAGLAALVWATPYGTSSQAVVDRIAASADRIAGTGTLWSAGRINAAAAVDPLARPSPPLTPSVACSPRPEVRLDVVRTAPGRLEVTVRTQAGSLRSLQFPTATNARITTGTHSGAGSFAVELGSADRTTFAVERLVPGLGVTVPLVVVDGCGEWRTFVGGGPDAF
jgi:thermitase